MRPNCFPGSVWVERWWGRKSAGNLEKAMWRFPCNQLHRRVSGPLAIGNGIVVVAVAVCHSSMNTAMVAMAAPDLLIIFSFVRKK